MAWQAPRFDTSGKSYTVDPAPVSALIKEGSNIQRDSMRGLATIAEAGLDVTAGMMARRQLAELKTKLSSLDPTKEDYPVQRANLLAENSSAFTNPRTRDVAGSILKGFDTSYSNAAAQQRAATSAAGQLARMGVANDYRLGQMAMQAQYGNQRAVLQDSLRDQNARDNGAAAANLGLEDALGDNTGRQGSAGAPGPAAPAGASANLGFEGGTDDGLFPDERDYNMRGGGSVDTTLLQPGDVVPAAAAAPAAANPYQQTLEAYRAQDGGPARPPAAAVPPDLGFPEEDDLGAEGVRGAPGASGAPAAVPASDIAGPPAPVPPPGDTAAAVAAEPNLADHPGASKAVQLAKLKRGVASAPKGTNPALISRAQDKIAALTLDNDVIDLEAQYAATKRNRAAALSAKSAKDPADTEGERKERVKQAVAYEMAADKAMMDAAQNKVKTLRSIAAKSNAPEDIAKQVETAEQAAVILQATHDRKAAEVGSQWESALRRDPDALKKHIDNVRAEERRQYMNGLLDNATFPDDVPAKPAADDEELTAIKASAFRQPANDNQKWTDMKNGFDERVGTKKIYKALADSVKDDGSVDQNQLEFALQKAFMGDSKDLDQVFQSAGRVKRPWWASDNVTFSDLISERAKELIQERKLRLGETGAAAAAKNNGVTYNTRKIP